MPSRYDLDPEALARALEPALDGEPPYRFRQLWDGLYRRLADPSELQELPRALRVRLADADPLRPALSLAAELEADAGATVKWLFALRDGAEVETVLMRYPNRATVCVSSQAGCAMGCTFCATGQGGFSRQLTTGEIVEQVVWAARVARDSGARLSNVVFMGMGEPLANYGPVVRALRRLHGALGLSARHLTVSTVGVVPAIHRLAAEGLPVKLALSLHAANDSLRSSLVPLNARWPLESLAAACAAYAGATGRRVSLEWALMDGVNDTPTALEELVAFARPLAAHVNLIPLNPTPGWPVLGSPPARVACFAARLGAAGIATTVRQTRGVAIAAACGQLAMRSATPARAGRGGARGRGGNLSGQTGALWNLASGSTGPSPRPSRTPSSSST